MSDEDVCANAFSAKLLYNNTKLENAIGIKSIKSMFYLNKIK